ncbi:hypothetical protein C2S51_022202 [Perilla frutescens var. frutescens]|nr:hypothetical protein C2S51_022202 [Perilla frutescens var. frutescens]
MEKQEMLTEKVTRLITSDGHVFSVEEAVFVEMQAIHRLLPAGGDITIPISQITGEILAKVIDYCRKHVDHKLNRLRDEEISAWDSDFVDVDEKTLFDLFVASHFLDVKDLFNMILALVAEMTKKKNSAQPGNIDQLRSLFTSNFRL